MAKRIILNTAFWHKQKVNKLKSKDATMVFAYLLSNPKITRTGIYTIFSEEIASGLGRNIIDAEQTRAALEELETTGLIKYEHEADVVYIVGFRQYSNFASGKPSIVANELLAEFEEYDKDNKRIANFWFEYVQENQEQLLVFEDRLNRSRANTEKVTIKPLLDLILPNKK